MSDALVTHASQVRDTSVIYATRADVLKILGGVNKGTDGQCLANLGDTRDTFIDLWLQPATAKTIQVARRDFDYHEDVQVALNGNDSNRINLAEYGMSPLLSVSEVEIDDDVIDSSVYVPTRDGWLQRSSSVSTSTEGYVLPTSSYLFAYGVANVKVTATWGYEEPPNEIVAAANLFAASYVLAFVEAADSNTGADVPGGEISWQMGDLRITQRPSGSRYSGLMKTMHQMAAGYAKQKRAKFRLALVTPEPRMAGVD